MSALQKKNKINVILHYCEPFLTVSKLNFLDFERSSNRVSKGMDDQPTLKNNHCGINLDAKVKKISSCTPRLLIFSYHTPLQTQKK